MQKLRTPRESIHYYVQKLGSSANGTPPQNGNQETSENNHHISLLYVSVCWVSLLRAIELAHFSSGWFINNLSIATDRGHSGPCALCQGQRAKQLPEDPEMLVTGEEVASALSGDSTEPVQVIADP